MGKTKLFEKAMSGDKKHPHGRGEDFIGGSLLGIGRETPPRAWGRQGVCEAYRCRDRNTPTGVGKTRHWHKLSDRVEKHPHGRGEDSSCFVVLRRASETPPRAWGRLMTTAVISYAQGNIPTGVGKTTTKHDEAAAPPETPPRAWGRPKTCNS